MGVGKTRDRNSDIFIDGQNVKVLGGVGCSARHAENGGGVGWGWDEGGGGRPGLGIAIDTSASHPPGLGRVYSVCMQWSSLQTTYSFYLISAWVRLGFTALPSAVGLSFN